MQETLKTLALSFKFAGQSLRSIFAGRIRPRETLVAISQIGAGSVGIIVMATTFSGVIVSVEIAWHMDRALQTTNMIPMVTGQFTIRELGVVLPALLMVSKAGAAMAAEIGTMKVTEQIDALKLLGIKPVEFLVVPRLLASIVSMLCLGLISITITLIASLLVTSSRFHFMTGEYLQALRPFIETRDLVGAVLKSLCFGAIIPLVSCAYGFRCRNSADGVGNATTEAVVTSTLAIILFDFALTYFLK